MIKKVLHWLNYGLGVLIALLALSYLVLLGVGGPPENDMPPLDLTGRVDGLPPNSFVQDETAYHAIDTGVLNVEVPPPKLQLPDLRPHLTYYGTNDRPDFATDTKLLHFGLKGSEDLGLIAAGEPLYLQYDASSKPGRYLFSSNNAPTGLWIEAEKDDDAAKVYVKMLDPKDELVTEPKKRATLTLKPKDFARFGGGKWEIGKWRVDGTLLARQRARWYGQDHFLNTHGGAEFVGTREKERIEFGEKDQQYVVYIGVGDCLIWDGEQWKNVVPGEASKEFPMLCLQKIEDRLLRWELWDVGGKGRVTLNLVRSKEAWSPKTYERDFKYVSARTLSQYNFEIKKDRVVLRPYDWLLLTDEGWVPLTTVEEIDAYVERKTPGVLFVFEGPVQREEKQVLGGTFYSKTRTNIHHMDFALDQAAPILRRTDEDRASTEEKVSTEEKTSDGAVKENQESESADFESLIETEGESTTAPQANLWPGALESKRWRAVPVPTDPEQAHRQPGRLRKDLRTALENINPQSDDNDTL